MGEPVHTDYLGINRKIAPEDLSKFEAGGFTIEEKFDGWWCCFEVLGSGVNRLHTRHNHLIDCASLEERELTWHSGTKLIGEWMPDLEELWVHDIIHDGIYELKATSHESRRWQLEAFFEREVHEQIKLIPNYKSGFKSVYDSVIQEGGEGVVLKHNDSLYSSRLKSRKTGMWAKCKPQYAREKKTEVAPISTGSGQLWVSSGHH